MKILGIESSCDETAAAVVEDGQRLLSNVVHSQIDIHAHYGGVIPEIAARSHIEAINPVINQALTDANCTWDDIDAIAVTYAPGLVGSLLVGSLAARTLAIIYNKPLYGIHHVEAHVYANFITSEGSDSAISSSAHPQTKSSETASRPTPIEYASVADGAADVSEDLSESSLTTPPNQDTNVRVAAGGAAPKIVRSENENFRGGPADRTRDDENEGAYGSITAEKIALLRLHLDLYDRYQPHLHRPFETLKRFFKIYVNSFDGAAELRDRLMHTKTTAEVRGVLEEFGL